MPTQSVTLSVSRRIRFHARPNQGPYQNLCWPLCNNSLWTGISCLLQLGESTLHTLFAGTSCCSWPAGFRRRVYRLGKSCCRQLQAGRRRRETVACLEDWPQGQCSWSGTIRSLADAACHCYWWTPSCGPTNIFSFASITRKRHATTGARPCCSCNRKRPPISRCCYNHGSRCFGSDHRQIPGHQGHGSFFLHPADRR